jgi:hypothetical protein
MFNSSPIETWEGAEVFFSFAGGAGTHLFFWLSVVLCIVPLYYVMKDENKHEDEHK